MKILLVEDDADLLDVTAYSLRRERFDVVEASDGFEALRLWKTERPDVVILDIGLPRHDGFWVLQRIREQATTPVVMLSGRTGEKDLVRAYGLGADDYVVKPFIAKQLALRIRAIARRARAEAPTDTPQAIPVGGPRIEPEAREVVWNGEYIRLTPTEFRLFHILAMNLDHVVSTSRLLNYVWADGDGDQRSLRAHMSHLRWKLKLETRTGATIAVQPGVGYRLCSAPDAAKMLGLSGTVAKVRGPAP